MDKSLKIVLIAFAIYTVLSLQLFMEKGFWLIPYNYNPLTIFLVSLFITINSYNRPSFKINFIYLIGVSLYCFLSERTLFLVKLYLKTEGIEELIASPFIRLIAVFGLSFSLIYIFILYLKQQPKNWFIFIMYLISFALGLLNYKWLAIFSFSIVVVSFYLIIQFNKQTSIKTIFQPLAYQLLFFIIVENLFFHYS